VSWHYQLTKICHLSWKSSYFFNGQLLSVNFKHVWFLSADFREIRSCDWFIIAWLNTDGWLDWWDVCLVTIVRYLTVRYFVLWRIRHVTATCRWRNQLIKTVCVTWNIGSQKLANFCRPTVWADFYPSCVIGYRMFYKPSVFRYVVLVVKQLGTLTFVDHYHSHLIDTTSPTFKLLSFVSLLDYHVVCTYKNFLIAVSCNKMLNVDISWTVTKIAHHHFHTWNPSHHLFYQSHGFLC